MAKSSVAVHRIPLTQARAHLGKLAKRAFLQRECFILEKDGIPLAGLLNVDDLEDYLELRNPKVQSQIAEGYGEYRSGKATSARAFLTGLRARK